MKILGISAFYHDSAACLVVDGEIIAAAQEERFTRKKHDHSFPKHTIAYCLREGEIATHELDYVAFYDKPFLKFERILETYLAFVPRGLRSFIISMPIWIKEKLWIRELIRKELGFSGKIIFPEHHESHAASAFYPSPFKEAAILTMDGVGEWATTSFGVGKDNDFTLLEEIQFPHSLGLLYSAFTYYLGFKVNSGEYKIMGLAPYGTPGKFTDLIFSHLIDLKEDGSFKMNMDYFNYGAGLTMTSHKFHELFGGSPRAPEAPITQREMDIARSLQEATEEIVLRIAAHVHAITGKKYLCLAGGVALNCVANGKLLRSGIFEDIWVQPAASDAGGALGAALLVWYKYLGNTRRPHPYDSMRGSYLGPEFTSQHIEKFLKTSSIPYDFVSVGQLPSTIAKLLAQEKVIGWFQGRMEFGPRALGARSIIGDARSPKMQSIMNLKIKFRESFRPFAPAVLAEHASDYFEIDRPSPYMSFTADVRKEHRIPINPEQEKIVGTEKLNHARSDIPAVTHVDYSARIQTVHYETHPLFHSLISAFYEVEKCPVIINTSFNVRGEPIVCTPKDAFRCFMRTNMDYLVLGNFLLDKANQKVLVDDADWSKTYELD